MTWLDPDTYNGQKPAVKEPVDLADLYSPTTTGLVWLGTATLHWRKALIGLVAVLVLGGAVANAGSPVQPPGATVRAATALPRLPAHIQAWTPASECARISRPVSAATMRWCSVVARYLHAYGDWDPGDLTKLMRIIDCESRGREWVVNRSSRATGLFQHLPRYWPERSRKAARVFGFTNPTITMAYDNIAVGIWLYETGGTRHWPTCGRR